MLNIKPANSPYDKLKSACIESKETMEQYGNQRKNDPRLYVRNSFTNSS